MSVLFSFTFVVAFCTTNMGIVMGGSRRNGWARQRWMYYERFRAQGWKACGRVNAHKAGGIISASVRFRRHMVQSVRTAAMQHHEGSSARLSQSLHTKSQDQTTK
jgi:hypothetical protein